MKLHTLCLFIVVSALAALGALGGARAHPVGAEGVGSANAPTATPSANPHTDGNCLACHSQPLTVKYADGNTDIISFDPQQAVHNNFACTVCHQAQATYPHEDSGNNGNCAVCHWQVAGNATAPSEMVFVSTDQDKRAMVLDMNNSCQKCHAEEFTSTAHSAHAQIMAEGDRYAPVCVDCHGSHNIAQLNGSRSAIAKICSKCHMAEYTEYLSSVHGAALYDESNPDVPTCADCHGTHNVTGPSDPNFRSDSIALCGKCHGNQAMMSKYGISTDVFTTYLDDFHGRTVNFFRETGEINVPTATCYDCHGVHNIRKPDDPLSTVYPTNLQATCSKCHADASIRFPQAWLNHYEPTWDRTPALFVVNQGYLIFVPTVIGGFVFYIALDARRRAAGWLKKRHAERPAAESHDDEEDA
ncbi:MAG TPA: hypothetical protein VLZ89_12610 [Anaerolineales bacterium]|nr:hypothetical protein [Anaerolineales bacterium]